MNKLGAYQKKAFNVENVRARYDVLGQAARLPHQTPKAVAEALVGQRAFCALSLPKLKIAPLSLNTYKKLSRELYSAAPGANGDGFVYIEALRVGALAAIEKGGAGASSDGKDLEKSDGVSDGPRQLRQLESHNVRQLKAYLDLHGKIKALVKEPGIDDFSRLRLFKVLNSHQEMFADLLAPTTTQRDELALVVTLQTRSEP